MIPFNPNLKTLRISEHYEPGRPEVEVDLTGGPPFYPALTTLQRSRIGRRKKDSKTNPIEFGSGCEHQGRVDPAAGRLSGQHGSYYVYIEKPSFCSDESDVAA